MRKGNPGRKTNDRYVGFSTLRNDWKRPEESGDEEDAEDESPSRETQGSGGQGSGDGKS